MRILRKFYCKMPELASLALFVLVVLTPAGCSTIIGGYEHYDMSKSPYREHIRIAADKLAKSSDIEDKAAAAELYGSINELELMDKCIIEYSGEEPELGWYLMMKGDKIHKFYKSGSGPKSKTE
jgi:hypothetical protein